MTRTVVLALLVVGCWHKRPTPPPHSPEETRALEIAGRVYGKDLSQWRVVRFPTNCVTDAFRPAFLTFKKNCRVGVALPYVPQIGVGWIEGETTLGRSGFCSGAQEAAEVMQWGAPGIYCNPDQCAERAKQVLACEAALAAAGL